MDSSTLKERAADISKAAEILSDELARLHLPEPSFEHGLPAALHSDAPDSNAAAARQALLQKLDEYRALLTEPTLHLTPELRNPLISVHSVVRLGIAEAFPSGGITVQDLAGRLNLREGLVSRLLAHCATHHIYYQAAQDFFIHTAASRVLKENEGMRKWILIGAEELIPATLKAADALVKYPNSEEPEHSGWSLQNSTNLPVFRALANMPDRAMVFAGAMTWHAMLPGFSPQYLAAAFPWGPSSEDELTIVDVGGGLGHVSQALIAHNPNVRSIIVQDSLDVISQAQKQDLPPNIRERMEFQAHDFFQEQPVKGADVYLLRLVLHDWSDKYAVMIIRALIPALKPGVKIVVNDRVIPGRGKAHYLVEREARDYDMYMLALQNAKERTAEDWRVLFEGADSRFRLVGVHQPPKSSLAVVEVIWEG
ncbi:MAG: hypothetical protein LQ339_007316 [Xanthoria mediterranea]|nr:MAG: hypothetical protein LQ339_007316 [Xanthoria mediterranea]